jgi:hypothetical protein
MTGIAIVEIARVEASTRLVRLLPAMIFLYPLLKGRVTRLAELEPVLQ